MPRPTITLSGPGNAGGYTLLEVMIALAVLSTGMLGIALMYADAMRNLRLASTTLRVNHLAASIAESVWSNPLGRDAYIAESPVTPCDTDTCSPTELASIDILDWQNYNSEHLPPNSSIAIVPNDTDTVLRTTIGWQSGTSNYSLNLSIHTGN
jgi:prepilin-type N-terminal cleavage/methylation domain-containing protein